MDLKLQFSIIVLPYMWIFKQKCVFYSANKCIFQRAKKTENYKVKGH